MPNIRKRKNSASVKAYFFRNTAAFLLLFIALSVEAQQFYFHDDTGEFTPIAGSTIKTHSKYITISWSDDAKFDAPYEILQIVADDTVAQSRTEIPSIVIKALAGRVNEIRITDTNNICRTISIDRGLPWLTIACIIVGVVVVFLIIVLIIRSKRKGQVAVAQPEAANVRRTQKFDCVTILFSDIQGFTKITEHLKPEQLVDELDRYFIYFDELVEKFGVEKIKTIGDAYMCAGGVPHADSANPIEVVLVGLQMIEYVKERQSSIGQFWNMRVGINTGPAISAILGYKKKTFDIWGDSVNTASRMESSGVPGEVNVSGSTYAKVRDYFECEYRGRMPVKYKGEIDMYFIKGLKPEYSDQGSPYRPNALLMQKMQMLKIHDLEQSISNVLNDETHAPLRNQFEMLLIRIGTLARAEKLRDTELLDCKLASIFAFVQMKLSKDLRTKISMAEPNSIMKRLHLTEDQIDVINKATSRIISGRRPESSMEEIFYDASNEYLGRKDFVKIVLERFTGKTEKGHRQTKKDWLKEQRRALSTFKYYTQTAKQLQEVEADEQLKILEQFIRSY